MSAHIWSVHPRTLAGCRPMFILFIGIFFLLYTHLDGFYMRIGARESELVRRSPRLAKNFEVRPSHRWREADPNFQSRARRGNGFEALPEIEPSARGARRCHPRICPPSAERAVCRAEIRRVAAHRRMRRRDQGRIGPSPSLVGSGHNNPTRTSIRPNREKRSYHR